MLNCSRLWAAIVIGLAAFPFCDVFAQCAVPDAFVCCGDVNHDSVVDQGDLAVWIANDGCTSGCCPGDADLDGDTDQSDLGIIAAEMDEPCSGYQAIPLLPWDPDCYDAGCDAACQAAKGCLPLAHRGVAFFDFTGDGWVDAGTWAGSPLQRRLYRNVQGASWEELCLLSNPSEQDSFHGYSCSFADWNGDGLPEYVNEPRTTDTKLLFLVNPGNPSPTSCFVSTAACLGIDGAFRNGEDTETAVFADLDGDSDIDLFLPAYDEPDVWKDGNHLFMNLNIAAGAPCPASPPTILQFDPNAAGPAALNNHGTPYVQPEGAQACDLDGDSDLDLAFCDRIWQNITVQSDATPIFRRLDQDATGLELIGEGAAAEEGLAMYDTDLDGDFDLIRRNFGDGGTSICCTLGSRRTGSLPTRTRTCGST